MRQTITTSKEIKLPEGILAADLKMDYKKDSEANDYPVDRFELWYTNGFGWVIPTLLINRARRGATADRTYAIAVDGRGCRVGQGPHVLRQETVYVRPSRIAALQKYLDLKTKGEINANETRDRISSRRMATQARRTNWF